jgi:hypothetical protein
MKIRPLFCLLPVFLDLLIGFPRRIHGKPAGDFVVAVRGASVYLRPHITDFTRNSVQTKNWRGTL